MFVIHDNKTKSVPTQSIFLYSNKLAYAKRNFFNTKNIPANTTNIEEDQMEIVYVGDRNSKNRALLIPNDEWKRLGKILTKKLDEVDAKDASKRLKEMRREKSKKMVDGWDNTELVSWFRLETNNKLIINTCNKKLY